MLDDVEAEAQDASGFLRGGRGDGGGLRSVVNSVVKNLVTPLIALAGGAPDFSAIRTGFILWGNILNDVLTFLITAAVVYFAIIVPVNRLMALLRPSEPQPQVT